MSPKSTLLSLVVVVPLAGCSVPDTSSGVTSRRSALTQTLGSVADTFINSANPDNNNGTSPSIFTGENGQLGLMRGLLRFEMPAAWQGRATVTAVTLTMVTRGTGLTDSTPPTAATESLQSVTVSWVEGAGFGDGTSMNTVGQACGATGATWNQPDCAGGVAWSGGSVSTSVSATAAVAATLGAVVTWDSAAAGNTGMISDVQSWIDAPSSNVGWRLASTTEGTSGAAQRFYSREGSAAMGPSLSVILSCPSGACLSSSDGGGVDASGATDAASPRPDAADASSPRPDAADASSPAKDAGAEESGGGGGCSCSLDGGDHHERDGAALLGLAVVTLTFRRWRERRDQAQ
jgi:MYXO-CTERM domain-containing protein